jgi:predicted dehydrogenase
MNKLILTAMMSLAMTARAAEVRLITLDPGHFHASLVQKARYPQVDPVVHVYAPAGPDLDQHLKRIAGFNLGWDEKVHTGPDFLAQMIKDRPGNVVVISGNNAKKTRYIMDSVDAGLNVLADKPMAINPADFQLLRKAFTHAERKGVLLYDIMTERHEITTVLQRELSQLPAVFGTLVGGSPEHPAITKESVHHYSKLVAGKPLTRPPWFFDVRQQGEGIVDVTTHLVDLIQWECFPDQALDWQKDIHMIRARRWATKITPAQFKQATQLDQYPGYLKADIGADNTLNVYGNGEFSYLLRGVCAKVSVTWNFEAPAGAGDTHYSMMRGTKANLVIRQGSEQNFKPTLYVENSGGANVEIFEKNLKDGISKLNATYPDVTILKTGKSWEIVIPDKYRNGHEAHFAQVTEKYLRYLADGRLPAWEVPNMLAKYYTTTKAYELSR